MNAMNQNDIPAIDENISRWAEKACRLSDERFEQLRLLYPSNQTLTENQAFLRGLHFAVDIYHQHNGVVNPGTEAVEEKLAAWSRCYMRQLYDRAMPPTETDDAEWEATMNDPNLLSFEEVMSPWHKELERIQAEQDNAKSG